MTTTIDRLSARYGALLKSLAIGSALMLLGMTVLVNIDLLLRNVTDFGLNWATEVTEYALYLMTLCSAPWLLRCGQHVRLDLLLTSIPLRLARTLEIAGDMVGFVTSLAFAWYTLGMVIESWSAGSLTIKNLSFPEWWTLAPMPVTFLLLAVEFLFRLGRLLATSDRRVDSTAVG